ncbi:acyltransferase [Magnetospirillum fulvum]|uniref:Acetyltransferase (Isoleucine patch superfamily) n=1 Tax=Magnetospirillum fulvum TaxID=1082 RepID=A0A1H6H372_MAGFU|nr:acyltransferase [Magnetospirillum fulvum]SEH30131.1 Acetyltransferase (isoleucine patch superfamily) [Magnetospirillum fulvum]
MRRNIEATDHAFASGPVYLRINSFLRALRETRNFRNALLVRAVWKQFCRSGQLAETVRLGAGARVVNLNNSEALTIGRDSVIRGILRLERQGIIAIGESVYIGDASILSAMERIEIGQGTLVAHNVQIFDNDSHPINAEDRVNDFRKKLGYKLPRAVTIAHAPVSIGERCWLGMNSIVMKGVTIGNDTIVASGSVVVTDLPPSVIAAGNPARVVKVIAPS